jgi:hypothetical protein
MYILPRFGLRRATVSHAPRALSALEAELTAPSCAQRGAASCGRPGRLWAALPRPVRALWMGRDRLSVHCAHGPISVSAQKPFKNEKFLFYFHSVSN